MPGDGDDWFACLQDIPELFAGAADDRALRRNKGGALEKDTAALADVSVVLAETELAGAAARLGEGGGGEEKEEE